MSAQSSQDWPQLEDSELPPAKQQAKNADPQKHLQPTSILKREPIDQSSTTSSTQPNTKVSYEERERAYKAARDEIFGSNELVVPVDHSVATADKVK